MRSSSGPIDYLLYWNRQVVFTFFGGSGGANEDFFFFLLAWSGMDLVGIKDF